MSKRKPEEKQKELYNPQLTYEWKADDMFQISGIEIEKINKALIAASSGPEFQKYITIFEGLAAFQNFFKESVEEGLIKAKETGKPSATVPETTAEAIVETVES